MLFSIIIPTYNRAHLVIKTIYSALNQLEKSFEIIVVDDGSSDQTEEKIKLLNEPKVSYFKITNSERGAARNFGALKAKGDYLYFLDSDDIIYKNHLHEAKNFIDLYSPSIFFQQYEIIKNDGSVRSVYKPKQDRVNDELVKKGNFMSCHGVFIEKKLFLENQFNEDRRLAGSEDYELWLRLAARFPIYYSPLVTSALVEHENRSVLRMDKNQLIERKELMLEYVFKDQVFLEKYGRYKSQLMSDAYSYISLHSVLSGDKKTGIKYFIKAIFKKATFLFSKRSFSILYRLVSF